VDELERVLILRYGLDGDVPLTLQEVATRLGTTREQVRELEERALREIPTGAELRRPVRFSYSQRSLLETPAGAEFRRRARLSYLLRSSILEADHRPPICPRCGVTMVPAAPSLHDNHEGDWVCLECEELDEE
jgi:hypothetical protein